MRNILIVLVILTCNIECLCQSIAFNKTSISTNENLEVTVTLNSEKIKNIGIFPELKGFIKKDSIIKNNSAKYLLQPAKAGEFTIEAFKIKINNQIAVSQRIKITVTPGKHFSDFFKNDEDDNTTEPVSTTNYRNENLRFKPTEDAFLYLNYTKSEVYVGEAIPVSIALYIIEKKADKYDFVDFEKNYAKMISDFKPNNCLEENIAIEKIESENISINGNKYLKYKLFESVFFPISHKDVHFKATSLPLSRQKTIGKDRSVLVQLPSLSLKTKVLPKSNINNVGEFRFQEAITKTSVKSGEAINYILKVTGNGNIANLNKPIILNNGKDVEFYETKTTSDISKINGTISGTVSYHYQVTAKQSGNIALGNIIIWPSFNPVTSACDTFKSRITLVSNGDQAVNNQIAANHSDDFYKIIAKQNKSLSSIDSNDTAKKWANIGFIMMLSLTLLFVFKRNKNKIIK